MTNTCPARSSPRARREELRRRPRARGRGHRAVRRRGARARRRERRRQVDARQDPRRRPPARRRPAAARRRGGDLRQRQAVAGGGDRDHLPGADALPRPQRRREHLRRRAAAEAGPPHRRRRMRRDAAALFEQLGVRLDPDRLARGLSIADQQLVEIAKALTTNARVIVMDEPTAALTTTEVERLFGIAETLRAPRNAVLFISHRLEEVFALCQRVTVMRDGRHVLTKPIEELTTQSIIRAMVGRDMDALFPKVPTEPGRVVLQGRAADARGRLHGRLVRRAERRDRRARRARRRRAERGGARDLRHRPLGRGHGRDRRPAASRPARRRRRWPAGDRARARGPPPAGARHGLLDRAQRRARLARPRPPRLG